MEECRVMKRQLYEICILVAFTFTLSHSAQICVPGQYREHKTGICKSCNNLCQFATSPRAVSECEKHCPDYARKCSNGSYYDVNLSKCDSCSSICDQHTSRGTSVECEIHCPNEYAATIKPTLKCDLESYFNSALSRCDPCSLLCNQHIKTGSTADCKKYCPKKFEESLGKAESAEAAKGNVINIIIGVVGGAMIIAASVGLFFLVRRCCRSGHRGPPVIVEPPNNPEIPHAKVTYIPCPIHAQCVDSCTISESSSAEELHIGQEDDISIVREEERKFPMAHADLPYSARPVSGLHD